MLLSVTDRMDEPSVWDEVLLVDQVGQNMIMENLAKRVKMGGD